MAEYLTEEEKKTLVCGVCGQSVKSLRGLKIHKKRVCAYVSQEDSTVDSEEELVEDSDIVLTEKQEQLANIMSCRTDKEEATADDIKVKVDLEDGIKAKEAPLVEPPFEVVDRDDLNKQEQTLESAPVVSGLEESLDQLGIVSIPIGARVLLNGEGSFWKKDPSTNGYIPCVAVMVTCRVINKWSQGDHVYLQLDDIVSDDEWSCLESEVINGRIQLVSLKDPTPVDSNDILVPVPSRPPEVIDPVELRAYTSACDLYVTARDAKSAAISDYKVVNDNTRPTILAFLNKYGRESKFGKGDQKLTEGGFDAHYTIEEPKSIVARDEEAILKWLLDNGMTFAIKESLNLEEWNKLVDSGQVPKSVLNKLEKVEELPPKRKLRLFKIED